MSSLSKHQPSEQSQPSQQGLVNPIVDLVQPGGPFPYGDAILADGAGAWLIAPTLRPYFLSFGLPRSVPTGGSVPCLQHGALTGFTTMLITRLIGVSITVNKDVAANSRFAVVVEADGNQIAELEITGGVKAWRRDLDEDIPDGTTLSVLVAHRNGPDSTFDYGTIGLELEG